MKKLIVNNQLFKYIGVSLLGAALIIGLAFIPSKTVRADGEERPSLVPEYIEDGYWNDYCYFEHNNAKDDYGTLYLFGEVKSKPSHSGNDMYDAGIILPETVKSGIWNREIKVKSVIAKENTILPVDCSYLLESVRDCYDKNEIDYIDLSNADTRSVTNMSYMFSDVLVKSINLDGEYFDTAKVNNMSFMFAQKSFNYTILDTLTLGSNFSLESVETTESMFDNCQKLTTLDLSAYSAPNNKNMKGMFYNCNSLKSVKLFSSPSLEDMSYTFSYCSSLTELDLSPLGINSTNATIAKLCLDCKSLKTIEFGDNWDIAGINTKDSFFAVFAFCENLQNIYVKKDWKFSSGCKPENMFMGCSQLKGFLGTEYKDIYTNEIVDKYLYSDYDRAHIDGGESNPGYFSFRITPYADLVSSSNNFKLSIYIPLEGDKSLYHIFFGGKEQSLENVNDKLTIDMTAVAKELADEMLLEIKYGDPTIFSQNVSIASYLKQILDPPSLSNYHPVAGSMLRYGAAAQVFFEYNTDNLANEGIGNKYSLDSLKSIEIPGAPLDADAINNCLAEGGSDLKYAGINMTFEYNFKFMMALAMPEDKTWEDYENDSDFNSIISSHTKISSSAGPDETKKYIIINTGVSTIPLLKMDTTVFEFGSNKLSVLQYLYQAANSSQANVTPEFKTLCKALYEYYNAAIACVSK